MSAYETFLQSLEGIPWLENLGQPDPGDGAVYRIYGWGAWLGPEDPAVVLQNEYYMTWKDHLETAVGEADAPELAAQWRKIYDAVLPLARSRVPFASDQDAYYGPNMAVWSCCWFAALTGCWLGQFGSLEQPLKRPGFQTSPLYQWRIDAIWDWYAAGHWPCSFYWTYGGTMESAESTGAPKYLVVF